MKPLSKSVVNSENVSNNSNVVSCTLIGCYGGVARECQPQPVHGARRAGLGLPQVLLRPGLSGRGSGCSARAPGDLGGPGGHGPMGLAAPAEGAQGQVDAKKPPAEAEGVLLHVPILPYAATRVQRLAGPGPRSAYGRAYRPAQACSAAGPGCAGSAGAGQRRRAFSPSVPFGLPRTQPGE